jgi:hypothetical protein
MKRNRLVALAVALLLSALSFPAAVNASEQTSVWLTWGTSGNYTKASQYMRLTTKAPAHFWAMQWQWAETPSTGGYLGIQTDGVLFNGQVTEMAIFSVWGATASRAASGSTCDAYNPAGENGAGLSCRRAIPVTEGHLYYFQVTRSSTRNNTSVYSASIRNATTRTTYKLGTLSVPGTISIREINNFIEDFSGANSSCAATAPAGAEFRQPVATKQTPKRSTRMPFGGATLGSCNRADAVETVKRGNVTQVVLSK